MYAANAHLIRQATQDDELALHLLADVAAYAAKD